MTERNAEQGETSGPGNGASTDTAFDMPGGAPVPEAVNVEIYDQVYNLRGPDGEYIRQLAEVVDAKMRAVAAYGGTVDSLRVAVLAALNIADEMMALRARYEELAGSAVENSLRLRAGRLSEMLDEVLVERRAG